MKRIAFACDGGFVSPHFGHCEHVLIYTVENKTMVKVESMDSPEHQHGALPNLLKEKNVDLVIAGGMGQGAVNLLKEYGIEVITGARGLAQEVLQSYFEGMLKSTGTICQHSHEHHEKGECHHS